MRTSAFLSSKIGALELALRRSFWQPLRRMMEIFHTLPLAAALIVFPFLATHAQIREIYVSYLEDLATTKFALAANASTVIAWMAAALGLTLISAVLYVAHYRLSTMRINIISLNHSYADAGAMLRHVQRLAGLGLAILPWLGVVLGLLGARNYIADRYYQLRDVARVDPGMLEAMQHVPQPGPWTIALAIIALGGAMAALLDVNRLETIIKVMVLAIGPVAAAALFALLTDPIFLAGNWIAVFALALVYAGGCFWLETTRSRFISAHWFFKDTGINMRRRRRILVLVWALTPWVACALYFLLGPASEPQSPSWPSTNRWALFPVAMAWTGAAGLVVALVLDRFRETAPMQIVLALFVAALFAIAIGASFLDLDAIVSFYRTIGPIGATAFTLLFIISMLAVLGVLSQRSGFPALALVILAMVATVIFPIPIAAAVAVLAGICGFFVVMALLSRLWAVAVVAALLTLPGVLTLHEMRGLDLAAGNPKPAHNVREEFECWIERRASAAAASRGTVCPGQTAGTTIVPDDASVKDKPYPVFIIAVEGGGIYAASAASLFLARLEDRIPGFSGHVFAISGVSGGSIGATIFQALDQLTPKQPRRPPVRASEASRNGCAPSTTSTTQLSLTAQVCAIMEDDHFSPVVAAIVPEFIGTSMGRAETLAASFVRSVQSQNVAAAQALRDPFASHWQAHGTAPALVLNSTWVETGFRAAFAPFPLHDIDDSLYSFYDQGMPSEKNRSLMFAAVVSARFPGILPPFSVAMGNSTDPKRWNFVDGAYADNSGASTALALYEALYPIAAKHTAEIRVILLTSSNPEPDLAKINGTVFRDTLAPIDALLKVREGLGTEAVARACNRFYPAEAGKNNNNVDRNARCRSETRDRTAPMWVVEIEDQTYGLPLGWRLSRTTFDIISWMLGDFESCAGAALEVKQGLDALEKTFDSKGGGYLPSNRSTGTLQLNEVTLVRNSCVLYEILALLGGDRPGHP
jgi:hypothetical protein